MECGSGGTEHIQPAFGWGRESCVLNRFGIKHPFLTNVVRKDGLIQSALAPVMLRGRAASSALAGAVSWAVGTCPELESIWSHAWEPQARMVVPGVLLPGKMRAAGRTEADFLATLLIICL